LQSAADSRWNDVPTNYFHVDGSSFKTCQQGLISKEQEDVLAKINVYNMEGRYGDERKHEINSSTASKIRENGDMVRQWLIKQL
jgi:hypothetical protein